MQFPIYSEWHRNICHYFKIESTSEVDIDEYEKNVLQNWAKSALNKSYHIPTASSVYEDPESSYFDNYLVYTNDSEEISNFFIPLNPPPVPNMVTEEDSDFSRMFEAATRYILYAAAACQRLRVDDEVSRRSKLRWYSVLADIYDKYRMIVDQIPTLRGDKNVEKAIQIAEDIKKDKKKRNVLAKEVMAGRRINKILDKLHGQWHVIDLHDNITRDFLINNS